ncbi:copper chaperone PCu(A)C [Xanthomonas sp. NCPPB 2654]|uniref:copper chaperone PCu(A)C n=1 Tax=unclassified Xanthomonas TaxID=2643310 RepID=UPI0021E0ECA8|nr:MULTISPECIES: copper chaperone PCu(A)C [unclassified Xanthomonas]MDL5365395.1 copper chaperone PCu(A)C [Xanthomonas sp. NCPPB 2654]UYC20155.1 copper chaperone PCu(A)C [Xanthomonas sp. CFBP 8443]
MKTRVTTLVAAMLVLAACQPPNDHAVQDGPTAAPAPAADAAAAPSRSASPSVHIGQAWARATPPGAAVGAGYVTLRNDADTADKLVAIESPASARVEIHEMRMDGDVMKMRRLDEGLELPPHATVALQPSGNHLMFIEPRAPFVAGTPVEATLTFQHAPPVTVHFDVQPMGADGPGEDDHGQHMH